METNGESGHLMTFPCDFQIKIVGVNVPTFEEDMLNIVRKHFPKTVEENLTRSKASQQGKYLAITISLFAEDQKTLDALYLELTQHPDTRVVL